ncbi:MAG: transposase [Candidatus Omnitrophica bacterium]|nr:transposase [Candidatus Omnitrophota bacterium]
MARKPRMFVTGLPFHVVQRGNNKNPIFFSETDYLFFLSVLREAKLKHPCLIFAYCLMPNHFHLLIQPEAKENISFLIKFLGSKYVRYINKVYKRSGTLWEGRFKCSIVEEEAYFLTCLRYIETNPLRAGIVNNVEEYLWSSYRCRAFGENDGLTDLDEWYKELGLASSQRQILYRCNFNNDISDSVLEFIREMTNKGGVIGGTEFKDKLEEIIAQKIIIRKPGRPRKNNSDPVF